MKKNLVVLTSEESDIVETIKRAFENDENFNFFSLNIVLEKLKHIEPTWAKTLLNKELINVLQKIQDMDPPRIRKLEQAFYEDYSVENCPLCGSERPGKGLQALCFCVLQNN